MQVILRRQLRSGLLAGIMTGALVLSLPSFAQQAFPPERSITTQGHGEVKVKPDSLGVMVMVESRDPVLTKARSENSRKMQAIISALRGLNIPNMKLETQNVQVYPIQGEMQRDRLPRIVGYQVTNGLNVTVSNASSDNLAEYGSRILDAALNAGANNVHGLNFFLTDMSGPRSQALELAVKDARRNADAMARAADITISGVYSLEGYPQFGGYPRPPMPVYATMKTDVAAAPESMPVEIGETTVTSDVTARFKF